MAGRLIAILHPGEMGVAVGRALAGRGYEIVTWLDERGPRTRRAAQDAGFRAAAGLEEAVREAALVISLVPPDSALETARQVAAALPLRGPASPVYLDANSISPGTMEAIAAVLGARGAACVDGAVLGQARAVGGKAILLLSGPDCRRVESGVLEALNARLLDGELGEASAIKMCFASMTKGLVALFLESLRAAGRIGREADLLDLYRAFYPGTMETVERLLPTYPRHVERRLGELDEYRDWLAELGSDHALAAAAREVLEGLHAAGLEPDRDWTFDAVVEAILARRATPGGGSSG